MTDMTNEQTTIDNRNYERDRAAAEDDGTALLERTDDLPPPDLYHAAVALAKLIGADLPREAEYIGLVGYGPGTLGIAGCRACCGLCPQEVCQRLRGPDAALPWLADSADESYGAQPDGS